MWLLRSDQLLQISEGLRFSDSIIGVGKLLVEARRRLELGLYFFSQNHNIVIKNEIAETSTTSFF